MTNRNPADLIVLTPAQMRATVPVGRPLLGIDPGTKTLGLAVSDGLWMIASPLHTIQRSKFAADLAALKTVVAARQVGGLVLGLPVEMDGSEGKRCQSVRQLAANLAAELALPVALWDERLSTSAVERVMIDDMDLSRKKRGGGRLDQAAAAFILQGFLEAVRYGAGR